MNDFFNSLKECDKEISDLIDKEKDRLNTSLVMIASESLASNPILEAVGSILTSKYSEGYPEKRYYTGNQYIDEIEKIAIDRAKELFQSEHANVQAHSGSSANLAALFGVLKPGDKVMGLKLDHGGHLTHGHPVNVTGKTFQFVQYSVEKDSQVFDMDKIREMVKKERPKLIISGATAYPRNIDFKEFHNIAREFNCYSLADISHISGLVAGGVLENPCAYTDIVTTTTHKTLCGPRSAIILSKNDDPFGGENKKPNALARKIDQAVFPGLQGGPLEHVIAAKAVCFKNALNPDFKVFASQIVKNAKELAATLIENGLDLVSGGTDTHLLLIDLTAKGVGLGLEVTNALAEAGIYTNRNTVPYDPSTPFKPSGFRLGTTVLTQRGMKESEMRIVGKWIADIVNNHNDKELIKKVRSDVKDLCSQYISY